MGANYTEDINTAGGGYMGGFGGGSWFLIIAVVIFWLLFRGERGFDGGHRDGYSGGGDCCGVRGCRPAFYDESNWEEEKHLDTKFERVYDKECAIEKDIANDGEKTRNLIRDNYDKELERKLVEKDIIIQTQRNEAFTTASIAALGDKLGHKLAVIDEIVERIPQMPKLSACVTTPCNTEIVTGCGSPRRGRCDEDFAFAG